MEFPTKVLGFEVPSERAGTLALFGFDETQKFNARKGLGKKYKAIHSVASQVSTSLPVEVAGNENYLAFGVSFLHRFGQSNTIHLWHINVTDKNVRQIFLRSPQR